MKYFFILFLYIAFLQTVSAQLPELSRGYALLITPSIDSSGGKLDAVLSWDKDTNAYVYNVYAKLKEESSFGEPIASLSRFDSQYVFTDFQRQKWYEIVIEKDMIDYLAYGYMNIGIDVPAVHERGKVLILADETLSLELDDRLERLQKDLINEGWGVFRDVVPRAETFDSAKVMHTKRKILDYYNSEQITAVLLIGRIAVPYSGSFAADGHSPDHDGAWASDVFYGDIDGVWTDTLSNLKSEDERTRNRPRDGKFDQTIIPSDIEIAVGRVDMFNLPAFELSEIDLLKRYLDKNHRFRNGIDRYPKEMIISDVFGPNFKEGFSASAWMSFAAMTDWRQINDGLFREHVSDNDFLWGYGCGPGSFVRAEMIAYTNELATRPMRVAFTQLFGSYFGDWDSENNLMRAAIATEPGGLICVWSGRPHWFFHHTAFGETIGYSTLLSQNSLPNVYFAASPFARRMNHIALIGDPTLTTNIVMPPTNLKSQFDDTVELSWDKSTDSGIIGYYIYASDKPDGEYVLLNNDIIQVNKFTDESPKFLKNYYMVRAVKEERLHSGTFLNLSNGTITPDYIVKPEIAKDPELNLFIYPNPANTFTNLVVVTQSPGDAELKISDINGRIINCFSMYVSDYFSQKAIVLTDSEGNSLAAGAYYIEISINNIVRRTKLIIID